MWEGVVHVVPPPQFRHQDLEGELHHVLAARASGRGLKAIAEVGVYRPGRDDDFRVPDLVVVHPRHVSVRGVEGRAELVVEIRSPHDETYTKLPFYAAVGCRQMLVVDRDTCALELFVLRDGDLAAAPGPFVLSAVGVTIATLPRPGLRLTWEGGATDIVV